MKVLVIGQGGREHAIVKGLKASPSVTEVHCAPGNDGIALEALCHKVASSDQAEVVALCRRFAFDLVVIGPEVPLSEGLADVLRREGFSVFGPSQAAAQLEASKVFAKQFMQKAQVPTAIFSVVSSVQEVQREMANFTPPYVLKADGLAAGKGVFVCATAEELLLAARSLFELKTLGSSGERALLEQFQPGWELSYLVLTNGQDYISLPLAQDHKRLHDHDRGPNTGGMGVVSPLSIDSHLKAEIEEKILRPSVQQLQRMGLLYRGVLFVGIMVTDQGPTVLEYNVRFGDPETQAIMPLLDGDWGQLMLAVAQGELLPARWKPLHLACVVLAAEGYPDRPVKDVVIAGAPAYQSASSYFLAAGVKRNESGQWLTDGGRVLNAVGLGNSRAEAQKNAYSQAARVSWPGMQMRLDIGEKAPSPGGPSA